MLRIRSLWNRHRRKLLISLGVLGGGYALYKLYHAHSRRVPGPQHELRQRELDDLVKSQLQNHFENIQRISDTTTLPCSMQILRTRISNDLDLTPLTEKLMQGKGQSGGLTSKEKLDLWEEVKVLSFVRMASSLWSMTLLCLYVRVQVNILGRHLYVEIARGSESSHALDEGNSFTRHGQQDFIETADYLSTYGIGTLITNMQSAATEVLKEKQLKDPFSMAQLRETIVQILDLFMSIGPPKYWISYLVPESAIKYRQLMATSSNGFDDSLVLMDVRKLEQLLSETRAVLSSPDFANIVDTSLKKVVDVLVEEVDRQFGGASPSSIPLAKLLPRVKQVSPSLLDEPSNNKFVQTIRGLPDVQIFYTLLYANIPSSS